MAVEDRYASAFDRDRARPLALPPLGMAEGLAEAAVRFPSVPVVFCGSRALGEEWTYRYLAAALVKGRGVPAADRAAQLPLATDLGSGEPSTAEVRRWALAAGLPVAEHGPLRLEVWDAYRRATRAADRRR